MYKKKKNNSEKNNKLKILILIKDYVKKNGWSSDIIEKIKSSKFSQSEITTYFPQGINDILSLVYEDLNNKVKIAITKSNIINLSINKRIKKILITRFELINKDKIFYKKTFYFMLLPSNSKFMKKNLYKTIDDMWFFAGDNSTDFNFYTKRIVLGIIYLNALFVFFNKDIIEVDKNIDKNLKKISKIPKIKKNISFFKDNLPIFLKGIFS